MPRGGRLWQVEVATAPLYPLVHDGGKRMRNTPRWVMSDNYHTVIRLLALSNVLLFVVFFLTPLGGEHAYHAYKAAKIDDLLTWTIQLWVVVSTLIATGLLLRELIRRQRNPSLEGPQALLVDGLLLGLWWLIFGAIALYGFLSGLATF